MQSWKMFTDQAAGASDDHTNGLLAMRARAEINFVCDSLRAA